MPWFPSTTQYASSKAVSAVVDDALCCFLGPRFDLSSLVGVLRRHDHFLRLVFRFSGRVRSRSRRRSHSRLLFRSHSRSRSSRSLLFRSRCCSRSLFLGGRRRCCSCSLFLRGLFRGRRDVLVDRIRADEFRARSSDAAESDDAGGDEGGNAGAS